MTLLELNDQTLYRINNYQTQDKAMIIINGIEYQLNKAFAVAISQKFFSQYLLDSDISQIEINLDIKSTGTYNALADILQYKRTEVQFNETVLRDLFHVGIALEIQELVDTYKMYIIENKKLDQFNCIELLDIYFDISLEDKIIECIDFISSNFYLINQSQLKSISEKIGIEVLKRIFSNNKLMCIDEDSVANFIISLVKENNDFFPLIENIRFELCSEAIFNEIQEFCNQYNYQYIVKYLCDSIMKARKPNNYSKISYQSNFFQTGNVEMSASSIGKGSIYSINNNSNNELFCTENIPNSWIEWKLKQGYAIQPLEYIIRSTPPGNYNLRLQSWRVEGTTIYGETKILHEVYSSQCKAGEIRKFIVKSDDKFVSFKLIQFGKNIGGADILETNVFDFSGNIYYISK